MLETWYWVAGIVLAVVAVISLIVRLIVKSTPTHSAVNRQAAKVSGQNNTVRQASATRMQGPKEPQ